MGDRQIAPHGRAAEGRAAGPPATASGPTTTAHLATSSERTTFKERRLQEQAPYPVGRRKVGRLVLQAPRQATPPPHISPRHRSHSTFKERRLQEQAPYPQPVGRLVLQPPRLGQKAPPREKKWPTPVTTRALSHRSPLKPLPSPPHPSPCLQHTCPLPLGIHRPALPGMPQRPPPGIPARQHRPSHPRKRSPFTDPPNQHNHHP
jgi:hypothetical protein